MDFLKKEPKKELAFKQDSFDTVPPPPSETGGSQAPSLNVPAQTAMPAPAEQPMPEEHPDSLFMPPGAAPAPQETAEHPETHTIPVSQEAPREQAEEHFELPEHATGPGDGSDFDEQPISPGDFMEEDSFDWTHPGEEDAFDHNMEANVNPFGDAEPATQEKKAPASAAEDLSLPDLPDLPEEAMEESLGAHIEQKPATDSAQELPKPLEPQEAPVQEEKEEDLPELEDKDAEYLAENDALDTEESEWYVESHSFYNTLQDIKALKRAMKDADGTMKDWSELSEDIETQSEKVIDIVDSLQEDLIKIDTTLFEG